MPRLSRRRILSLESAIFRLTGKTMLLILRDTAPAPYEPGQLYVADTEPTEATADSQRYIYAKFEEIDSETFGDSGRKRAVKGVMTVPMMYKTLLAQAVYIDPYLDGSRFRKVGAIVDEARGYCTQMIEAYSLDNPAEVV